MKRWLLLTVLLASVCQAGTYGRFHISDKSLPTCFFEYIEWVDKDRHSQIYNPIYSDKPVQITVSSPTYFGQSWLGLTPLNGLQIGSYQGDIKPTIIDARHYQFILKPLPKAGEFYYFKGQLAKPINGLKVCADTLNKE